MQAEVLLEPKTYLITSTNPAESEHLGILNQTEPLYNIGVMLHILSCSLYPFPPQVCVHKRNRGFTENPVM